MKVIARIPALEPNADPAPRGMDPPATGVDDALVDPGRRLPRRRRSQRQFPIASVTVLALLAAFAWSMVSWNESRRLERARAERVARVQASQAPPGTMSR
ncbi:MAG: hypothetical protein FJ286_01580 [Planctomycetes bacterium]|nr:hypothetical protein [Planctomycetota bacterium]